MLRPIPRRVISTWQTNGELAAATGALAANRNGTSLHFDQPPRDREPDTEPAHAIARARATLGVHLENTIDLLRCNSDAVVPYAQANLRADPLGTHRNRAARFRVFRRVDQ